MALKRISSGEDGDGGDEFRPPETKRPTLRSVGTEVMQRQWMQRLLVPILEPTIRRVVREELNHAFLRFTPLANRSPIDQIQAPGARGWYLHFNTGLPDTLFTSSVITPIQIILRHADSGETIRSEAFSSLKVEIVVLSSDFGQDEQEDWTEEAFEANIVSERKGKRPLLAGELTITLRDGVGYFEKVTFTDNSSWIKSRKFRLGVRVVQSSGIEVRIREARSDAFMVKDHRGELYKKHDSPSLGDEVWRLKNIGRDGAFRKRLTDNGIETVQQFLRSWVIDADGLRNILGNGMSNKAWEETIQHAQKCVLDNKFYFYKYDGAELQVGLLFNSVLQVVAASFDWQDFQSLDDLNKHQMFLVEKLKQQAYKNPKSIVEFDPSAITLRPLPELQAASDPGSSFVLQNPGFITTQEELQLPLNSMHTTNPPHTHLLMDTCLPKDNVVTEDLQLAQPSVSVQDNNFNISDLLQGTGGNYGNKWSANEPSRMPALQDQFLMDICPEFQMPNWFPHPVSGDEVGPATFLNLSPLPEFSVHISGNCKPNKGWRKIGAPLKWGVLVRKDVAARRMAEFCS